MVQNEVRKKTKLYGTVAILAAIMLVATIYTVGSPTIILSNVSPMNRFNSIDELKSFLITNTNAESASTFGGGPLDISVFGGDRNTSPMPASTSTLKGAESDSSYSFSFSTTNIQVQGVDEADIIKTDGKYIYAISTLNNSVYIVNANPQDTKISSTIILENNTYPAGIFLSQDSNKLAIIGSQYEDYLLDGRMPENTITIMPYPYLQNVKTFVNIYDISEKTAPVLTRNFAISGSYFSSRMIDNYLYAVISEQAYLYEDTIKLPTVYKESTTYNIQASDIYYTDTVDSYFTYTTFVGLNLFNDAQTPSSMTILMGGTSNMYVSSNNMYVTYPDVKGEGTDIYRIKIAKENLILEAQGKVPGYILNQYSMDEFNGNFRVATTTTSGSWLNRQTHNNLYVLNMELTTIGKLENLAEGETIFSARFVGNKCYLVTFKQIDPFFVIDLSNPTSPKVAGELKIPGYSSYLHPYNENYVIGIGKEDNAVKLSLFDVTNMNNPLEIDRYTIDGDWTESEALYDPKAFLFDLQKQLLVIPVSITNFGVIGQSGSGNEPFARDIFTDGTGGFWQGAYVFELTVTNGFKLTGNVTHQENAITSTYFYGMDYSETIRRSLYIDNTLYTLSSSKLQLNNLDTLAQLGKVNLR
jgi:inhibitor of cysteine peptidase